MSTSPQSQSVCSLAARTSCLQVGCFHRLAELELENRLGLRARHPFNEICVYEHSALGPESGHHSAHRLGRYAEWVCLTK